MLDVKSLHLMQEGFRHPPDEVAEMIRFARSGKFDIETLRQYDPTRTNLIAITTFEDGELYIRDGFHRAMAVFIGRPSGKLFDEEYFVEHLTYQRMNTPNLGMRYYTPFDPRVEVRAANFANFWLEVEKIIDQQEDPFEFIKNHRNVYVRPRMAHHDTVQSFATQWLAKNPIFVAHPALVADIR